jgi:hypothetical protein
MNLPNSPEKYERANEAQARDVISQADEENHKKQRNIEVGQGCRVIFFDTVTGTRYAMSVASGAVVLTAL